MNLELRPSRDTPEGHAIFIGVWTQVMMNQVECDNRKVGYERFLLVQEGSRIFIRDNDL